MCTSIDTFSYNKNSSSNNNKKIKQKRENNCVIACSVMLLVCVTLSVQSSVGQSGIFSWSLRTIYTLKKAAGVLL